MPVIFGDDYKFEIGKGVTLREGTDVTLIATGLMVGAAIEAAETLSQEGISVRLINMPTIKPIDKEIICKAARETGCIVTSEEHNIIGGLGSAVAETVTGCCPVPVVRHGVEDVFGRSGAAVKLLDMYGLNAAGIIAKVKEALALKK